MATKQAGESDVSNKHLLDDAVNPALQTSNSRSVDILYKVVVFWSLCLLYFNGYLGQDDEIILEYYLSKQLGLSG